MPKKAKSALFRPRSWWKARKRARIADSDTVTSSNANVDTPDVTQQVQHGNELFVNEKCSVLSAPVDSNCNSQDILHDHCYSSGSVSKQVVAHDHCYFEERANMQFEIYDVSQEGKVSKASSSLATSSKTLSPKAEVKHDDPTFHNECLEIEISTTPLALEKVPLQIIEITQDEAVLPGESCNHESTSHEPTKELRETPVPVENPRNVAFSALQQSMPKQWEMTRQDDGFHFSQFSPDMARVVQRSVCVSFKGDVVVFAHGHELPRHHIVYEGVQLEELSHVNVTVFVSSVLDVVSKVRQLEICTGAENSKFKVWWKNSLETCYIDSNTFHESRYSETLRSKKCEYLINQRRRHCNSCSQVLVRFANRKLPSKSPSRKTPNKHKPLKYCTSEEKAAKNKRATKRIRNLKKQNTRLKEKLYGVIEEEGVEVDDKLSLDLQQILERDRKSEKNEKNKASRFQRIFIQQQLEASKRKNMRGMKWHPLMIRFALQLKMCGAASLKLHRKFIKLPSDRLLFDYSHIYEVKEGCQFQFINETAEKVSKRKHDYQKFFVLSFDEVSISQSLVQRKSTGEIVGYCHLNEVQTELLDLKKKLEDEAEEVTVQAVKSPPIAKKVLTYMIKGTASGIQTCVASYSVDSLTKEELYQHTWEVIGNLETSGIGVIACVFDGSPINRGFVKMHPAITVTESGVVFDTPNPFDKERPLFFIPDPPHNLKTTRNALENSGRKKSRCMRKNGEPLTWKPIVALYKWKSEQTVKKLHKLTAECVYLNSYSRMRVSYAARVFSNSVASQLKLLKWANTHELSVFINYK